VSSLTTLHFTPVWSRESGVSFQKNRMKCTQMYCGGRTWMDEGRRGLNDRFV
jgi:hypothetical protein